MSNPSTYWIFGRLWLGVTMVLVGAAQSTEGPRPIPVGIDAYRYWDRWPDQRIGMRAYMRSTYDRRGGNEGADASHFLYQLSDSFNVTLDLEGPGLLVFSRYNHWHGSPWHYVVDGTDHIVQESSTSDPLHPAPASVFLPSAAFPSPLNWTWATTNGADLVWTPIPFERGFQMAYTRTRYGTGYYIYDRFVPRDATVAPAAKLGSKRNPGAGCARSDLPVGHRHCSKDRLHIFIWRRKFARARRDYRRAAQG